MRRFLISSSLAAFLALVGTMGVPAVADEGDGSATSESGGSPEYTPPAAPDAAEKLDNLDLNVSLPGTDVRPPGATGIGDHLLYIKVWADEEYRNRFGDKWRIAANNSLERADDAMSTQFGIDIRVTSYNAYNSDDARTGPCGVLTDFKTAANHTGADIAVGFSGNFRPGRPGCADLLGEYAVVIRIDQVTDWRIAQHEISHIFGAQDRYNGATACNNDDHVDDVMECPYTHPDIWSADRNIVFSHRGRFR